MRWLSLVCFVLTLEVCAAVSEQESARELIRLGSGQLVAGKVEESIKTFEKAVGIQPPAKAHLWQLGIAYYYADRFEDGRKLFELHQTVNENDVENAVWHFLCMARAAGIDEARKKLIPISGDSRVPMKEVHALFSGSGTKENVIGAAQKVESVKERNNALCYAHLYLALYEEACGNKREMLEHIEKAAVDFAQGHYMGQIARLHAKLRAAQK